MTITQFSQGYNTVNKTCTKARVYTRAKEDDESGGKELRWAQHSDSVMNGLLARDRAKAAKGVQRGRKLDARERAHVNGEQGGQQGAGTTHAQGTGTQAQVHARRNANT